jgi:pimeloyl-ACP methyl ester carboxylesterase
MSTVLTDDGVKIASTSFGTGSPTLLLMHGWAGSGAYFAELLEYLDLTEMRAITYDLRGHGASDKVETGYDLDRFAQDALAVADHAGAEQVVAVGFSMSAKFAQYMACLAPERVSGLVLVAGCPASAIPFPAELQRDWVDRAGNCERLVEITRMFTTQPVKPEVFERVGADAVKVPRIALDETLNMALQTSFADRLQRVTMPTLVVGGIHDTIFTPDALYHGVVAPLPRARLALVDSNHEIPIEQPQQLALLIQAFLAGLGQ